MLTITRTRSPLADLQVATNSLNRLVDEAFRGWQAFASSDTPLAHGVLTHTLPKVERAKPRRITVQVQA